MAQTSIEWTELTWNPTTGCTKISAGCKFCYAEIMSRRLHAMGIEKYRNKFKITAHENQLYIPYTWKGNKIVFVNSMSDLFHEGISTEFIKNVFQVMNDNTQHIFQVLTKRSDRLKLISKELNWTSNIWMGVSVENQKVVNRIDDLLVTKARVKFLSCEPLIGPLEGLKLKNIDWVIVGGESAHKPRPMEKNWVENIKAQCDAANTLFFFKQWGGTRKKKTGRILHGRTYDAMPAMSYSA